MARRFLSVILLGLLVAGAAARAETADVGEYLDRGLALAKAGKPEQALPYLLLALEAGETRYAADDTALVPLLDTLAETYSVQGSFGDAEPLLKRSLTIQERTLANVQSGIARTLIALGVVYQSTGRLGEAGKLYNRVLAVWQPKLGADDPNVRAAREGLAKLAAIPTPTATPSASGDGGEFGDKAAVPLPAPGGPAYRIHLTSIRDAAGAEREWARLREAFPKLLLGMELTVRKADLGGDRGVFYRIQGGPLSKREAQDRCMAFAKRAVWCRVVRDSDAELAAPLLPKPAAPAGSDAAGARVAALTVPSAAGFRIHLTSIRDPRRAAEEWARLRRQFPALLGGLALAVERADLGAERGVYYRIEGGPLSRTAAQTLCGEFAARKIWCGIVPPANGAAESAQGQLIGCTRGQATSPASGTRRPDVPRRRRRIDRSRRGLRCEPGARRYGHRRRSDSGVPI